MSLVLDDDQKALAQTVKRFVTDRTPLSRVRAVIGGEQSYDPGIWQQVSSEIGIAGLAIPEEYGGVGGRPSDLVVALRELGAGLVPTPLLTSGVLAAGMLLASDDAAAKHEWLSRIADGSVIGTVAVSESDCRSLFPAIPATRATVTGRGITLTGAKTAVLNGTDADFFLVSATGPDGPEIYLVRRSAAGLSVLPDKVIDSTCSSATVVFEGTPAVLVQGDAATMLDDMVDRANLAVAAEQVGGMSSCLAMTTEYAKVRYSFGLPIGAYQGVKHKLADMYSAWSLADAALRVAAEAADQGSVDFPRAAASARVIAAPAYLEAAKNTMLLHGGIGFTWEHDAHLFYKNAIARNVLLGDADFQQDRLAGKLEI